MFSNFKLAGCLAIASAVMAIPSMILMLIDVFSENSALALANLVALSISATLFVLLMLYLRSYLETRMALGKQNILFGFIIVLGLLGYGVGVVASFLDPLTSLLTSLAALAPIIPLGILLMVVAWRILNVKTDSNGYTKAFAYLIGATGLFNATVLFSDLSVLLNIASDIILALMFFAESKQDDETPLQLENTGTA
ncbi:hypothetical protein HNE05_12565 [Aquipseudomonas campi]|uniref:Uncharacterized protein n=1 Tax=Aquipseudomonas campi TaxID=2731681 RepID=A0A6M8G5E2_9GAMM|nr:hypothetical protein [Pseudomonas campi]QKE64145.1 hypothetical protein HNE05_12565 [Pseudomonas campi]